MSTVLVVDDNSLVREGLRFMLTHAAWKLSKSVPLSGQEMAAAGLRESAIPLRAWFGARLKKQWKPSGEKGARK